MRHFLAVLLLTATTAAAGTGKSFKEVLETAPPRKQFQVLVESAQMFNYDANPNRYYFMTQMVSFAWEPFRPLQVGPIRMRTQVMATAFVAAILRGPETFYLGLGPRLRLLFPFGNSPWSFYLAGGAGAGYANANPNAHSDRGLGEQFTFILQGGGGFCYAINPEWSVWIGPMWHHLSNGNLSERGALGTPRKQNTGPDEVGVNVGTGWSF